MAKRRDNLEGLTTVDVVRQIIIPETQSLRLRYVDTLSTEAVSAPTYFVSHTWGRPFLELINSLKSYIRLSQDDEQSKNIFLWIDIFAVNQHEGLHQQSDLSGLHLAIQKAAKGTLVCFDIPGKLLTR